MHLTMPWFFPVGIAMAFFGSRTAVIEKRARGGRWRRDSLFLAVLVWAPLVLWVLACLTEPLNGGS
jgi:hypothetical protein